MDKDAQSQLLRNGVASLRKEAEKMTDGEIVGMEQQSLFLENNFEAFFSSNIPHVIFINGTPGTGKTMLVKHFLAKYKEQIRPFYFNAMEEETLDALQKHLLKQFNQDQHKSFDFRTSSIQRSISTGFSYYKNSILIIDEFDSFLDNEQKDNLYSFFNSLSDLKCHVLIILISNAVSDTFRQGSSTSSRFQYLSKTFPRFTPERLKQIILARVGKEVIDLVFSKEDYQYFLETIVEATMAGGDVRKVIGMVLSIIQGALDRMENNEDPRLSHRDVLELFDHKIGNPLTGCSQFEIVILYCLLKLNEEERNIQNLMLRLGGMKSKINHLIAWNDVMLQYALKRLEDRDFLHVKTGTKKLFVVDNSFLPDVVDAINNIPDVVDVIE
ncbi:hypothetical protein EIN_318790 [Entamoeba invadens IP1]|uniref:Origin recognition complex subunit 1 n=1 Tax=Entamoeba invadens IP1 TaxID=370355 RepID=A0A0A1TZI4_ENTIV|nr:hypothetical protein EIN_318790 [Entamoeba invadens IP1]ELP87010.1 hypothetical protein EIN_318790 [Entamoeba invadens IP1]|eukprot:XP_004253781.1 hypothetical protein EIN_318790 [Entamoeba invadens IP1]